jgi:hypothetical protein
MSTYATADPALVAAANSAAAQYGIDPSIFGALVTQESGWNQSALSPSGAIGLTQLMPATAAGLGVNPNDATQNLAGGAHYLAEQLSTFGNYPEALAAYNAGPGAVHRYGGIPPYSETQNYVKNILAMSGASAGSGAAPGSSIFTQVTQSSDNPLRLLQNWIAAPGVNVLYKAFAFVFALMLLGAIPQTSRFAMWGALCVLLLLMTVPTASGRQLPS